MPDLELTHEDAAFMVNFVPPHFRWPGNAYDDAVLRPADREEGGGSPLRLKILAVFATARRNQNQATVSLPLTPAELWYLDRCLWGADYQIQRMPNGTPMLTLANKLWDLMLAYHEQDLPLHLRVHKPTPVTEEQHAVLSKYDAMLGGQS